MLRKRPAQVSDVREAEGDDTATGRRAGRYVVPVVGLAGVAALTIGLVPAFAGVGAPDLPKVSAEKLIAKMAASDVRQVSGTVKIDTDLGLPSMPGGSGGGLVGDAMKDAGGKGGGAKDGAALDPQAKLMELATGSHTLKIAADGPEKHRLSVLDGGDEYTMVHNGQDVWAYASADKAVFHAKGPKADAGDSDRRELPDRATPQALAKQALTAVDKTTRVTVDGTAKIAGRDAYQLVIQPKQAQSTVDSIRIAVDAENGVPLKFTLSPKSGGKPVLDAGFTSVDFAKPDAGTFDFTPPRGAKVTEEGDLDKKAEKDGMSAPDLGLPFDPSAGSGDGSGPKVIGEGWASIAELQAPRSGSHQGGSGDDKARPEASGSPLDSFGDKVSGKFGKGTVFSTRLVNALMTEDGGVYVGAVDKAALIKAANAAH
ncbi:sigma-E factor regulatory protein RseB domain-containing protein [Streptomyces sp. NPDC002055]|uniref:LolA family protein n=1 Tax=Streptomyces sp. NPDC002055 TaxID=3154534 RepID=UPI00332B68FF